ncbi:nucleoside-triphosphatase [Tepidanaerobacter syntrophicus]|uniref:nucleoside-triphosphatase n=1 Tax=Tepidanaerobacter syntrophicus TaxID=224999 RepID=UPI001BD306F2|nr:nucleoside-triphosphatase [Tepidanaerobacter syntrophicus]
MKHKNLLLQGDIGIGKSTIIIDAIMPYIDCVGGYYTQRILKNKQKVGFLINPIENIKADSLNRDIEDIKSEEKQRVFICKNSNETWSFNYEVFARYSMEYLSESLRQGKKLLIVDELGGAELRLDYFFQYMAKIFISNTPVLGVLKSRYDFQKLKNATLSKATYENVEEFTRLIRQKSQIILLTPEVDNNDVASQVRAFVKRSIITAD